MTCDGLEIRDLLYHLGITEKYVGFFHTTYAVCLSIHQPERLLLVTKWLYPDVAKHYNTNWRNVERTIRTVAAVAWKLRPEMLSFLANRTLDRRPGNTQFISILVHYLQDSVDNIKIQSFP